MYLFIYLFIHLLIHLCIYLFTHLLIAYLTIFNSSNYTVLSNRIVWDKEPITMAAWPVPCPSAIHSRQIRVSAILCVFLLSSAGTRIARSATKCQKEIQKRQKHQPLSYIGLLCNTVRLQTQTEKVVSLTLLEGPAWH